MISCFSVISLCALLKVLEHYLMSHMPDWDTAKSSDLWQRQQTLWAKISHSLESHHSFFTHHTFTYTLSHLLASSLQPSRSLRGTSPKSPAVCLKINPHVSKDRQNSRKPFQDSSYKVQCNHTILEKTPSIYLNIWTAVSYSDQCFDYLVLITHPAPDEFWRKHTIVQINMDPNPASPHMNSKMPPI